MSQTITITIDKRPVTLTAKDVGELVRIARKIDINYTVNYGNIDTDAMAKLTNWLDNHRPEPADGKDEQT